MKFINFIHNYHINNSTIFIIFAMLVQWIVPLVLPIINSTCFIDPIKCVRNSPSIVSLALLILHFVPMPCKKGIYAAATMKVKFLTWRWYERWWEGVFNDDGNKWVETMPYLLHMEITKQYAERLNSLDFASKTKLWIYTFPFESNWRVSLVKCKCLYIRKWNKGHSTCIE